MKNRTIPSPPDFGNEEETNPRGQLILDEDVVLATDVLETMKGSKDPVLELASAFVVVRHHALDGWLDALHEKVQVLIKECHREAYSNVKERDKNAGKITGLKSLLENFPRRT